MDGDAASNWWPRASEAYEHQRTAKIIAVISSGETWNQTTISNLIGSGSTFLIYFHRMPLFPMQNPYYIL